jgi:2-keto-4-pentenoate hydratase/2-oxohepta-3-ene-1,7-dioic acid hydratase in catechol pathway
MIRIRLQRVGDTPTVVVERDGMTWDAPALLGHDVAIGDVIADVAGFADAAVAAIDAGHSASVERSRDPFLVPTVDRPAVYCAGANFADHVAEMGERAIVRAFHFVSPPAVLSAHESAIERPLDAEKLDWEVELVAVIGRRARRVTEAEALAAVGAYTVGNDVSVRGDPQHPIFGMDWGAGKNGDGLTAVGPALVPARDVADPQRLAMRLTVDGQVRQDSSTDQMLVTVAQQIAAISRRTTLYPGDLVFTGTPAGTARAHDDAYLRDGQAMIAEIAGIGALANTITATADDPSTREGET